MWKKPGQLMAGSAATGAQGGVTHICEVLLLVHVPPSWEGGRSSAARMNAVSVVLRPQMGSIGDVRLSPAILGCGRGTHGGLLGLGAGPAWLFLSGP